MLLRALLSHVHSLDSASTEACECLVRFDAVCTVRLRVYARCILQVTFWGSQNTDRCKQVGWTLLVLQPVPSTRYALLFYLYCLLGQRLLDK